MTGNRDLLTRHHRLHHFVTGTEIEGAARLIAPTDAAPQEWALRQDHRTPDFPRDSVLDPEARGLKQLEDDVQLMLEPTPLQHTHSHAQVAAPDFFDGYDWSTVFLDDNFADILDPVALSASRTPLTREPQLIGNAADVALSTTPGNALQDAATVNSDALRFGSRLPSLEPDDCRAYAHDRPGHSSPWTRSSPERASLGIDIECRRMLLAQLDEFSEVIPANFQLPTRHALNRFLALYTTGFNEHNPVIHLPTTSLGSVTVELTLAIASVGARYAHEKETCLDLLQAAQAIVFERTRRWRQQSSGAPNDTDTDHFTRPYDVDATDWPHIQVMQALVLMTGDVVFGHSPGAGSRESAIYRAMLGIMIREAMPKIAMSNVDETWDLWIKAETLKRIVLVAFTLFNLHTLLLNVAPTLLWSEIGLDLPCSEATWNATSPELWQRSKSHAPIEVSVQDAIQALFETSKEAPRPRFSSLGGFFLIHAVLQNIWMRNQMSPMQSIRNDGQSLFLAQTESALRRWRQGWENDEESSMNPVNPSGPIAFTSTALLRMAHVRLSTNARIIPFLRSWNPGSIANSIHQTSKVTRSDRATRAALHCAHALSIPVKIGLKFVAHTQSFYWACQHALSSLECAVFLARWLEAVTEPETQDTLSSQEALVLDYVVQITQEAGECASKAFSPSDKDHLSKITTQLWGKVFPDAGVWEIVELVAQVFKTLV
jgi:hypothetical protein